ncbi:MAG: endonuclease/exonuclease/phosphatase family protein [Phycisphaerales bacterium]
MSTHPIRPARRSAPSAAAILLLCAAALLPACRSGDKPGLFAGLRRQPAPAPATGIAIDGRFEDWPAGVATTADADWIYFKVTLPGNAAPLQANVETLALWLDADGSPATGAAMTAPAEAAGLGVDLFAEFSPPGEKPGDAPRRGVAVYAADAGGRHLRIPSAEARVLGSPTFAADTFEIRLSRRIDPAAAPDLARLLSGRARAKAMFALVDEGGTLKGWSDVETFQLPASTAEPSLSDAELPAKPAGAIRILSWNVLNGALTKDPNPFARIIQVLDPDIILFQEWPTDAATAQAWFTATVTGEKTWNAWAAPGDRAVVVVSQHPLASLGPHSISLGGDTDGRATPVRFAAATIQTPAGPVAVGSLHLKCCGTAGSSEDTRRVNEAQAINAAMNPAFAQAAAPIRILAGDFNLVGTRTPLDTLAEALDADGSALEVAHTPVLGDAAVYTWSDANTEFPDGRLDYALYSDASADLIHAFILDNRRLSDRALAKLGLDRDDTAVSDHFPLVLDLMPKP